MTPYDGWVRAHFNLRIINAAALAIALFCILYALSWDANAGSANESKTAFCLYHVDGVVALRQQKHMTKQEMLADFHGFLDRAGANRDELYDQRGIAAVEEIIERLYATEAPDADWRMSSLQACIAKLSGRES